MALSVEPFARALRDLSDALDRGGIQWAVAGAVAANNYRDETRTTSGLDVLRALSGVDIAEVQDWRDHADIESILVAEPDFDREYMARWFEEFDLDERFRRIEATAKERDLLSQSPRSCEPDRPAR